ncbi:MAG: accessory gene regulator B family protein [Erysipelotrichaceae bacterium]|nr:accessory gene regulator B family protein [Erysipelotrichaceae bacterium]
MKPLSHYLAKELTLSQDEEEIIAYGLFVFLFNGASIALMMSFGLILGCFNKTLLFMTVFIPLRLFLGGYHSSTPQKCIFFFTTLSLIFIIAVKYLSNSFPLSILTFAAMMLSLARNHQTTHYKRQPVLIVSLLSVILTYTQSYHYIICLAILMSLLLLNMNIA